MSQHKLRLVLGHSVVIEMRESGIRVEVEANIHH